MKRIVCAWAGALMLASSGGAALAADLPYRMPVKAAPYVAPPMPWYGSFIGVQAGYGFGNDPVEFTGGSAPVIPALGVVIPVNIAGNPRGFVGGVQYGTNWQYNRFVYGFLSDFSYSDIRSSDTVTLTGLGGTRTTTAEQKLNWFSTTRLRGGYLIQDNLLLYGSGGLASGRASVNASNFAVG